MPKYTKSKRLFATKTEKLRKKAGTDEIKVTLGDKKIDPATGEGIVWSGDDNQSLGVNPDDIKTKNFDDFPKILKAYTAYGDDLLEKANIFAEMKRLSKDMFKLDEKIYKYGQKHTPEEKEKYAEQCGSKAEKINDSCQKLADQLKKLYGREPKKIPGTDDNLPTVKELSLFN